MDPGLATSGSSQFFERLDLTDAGDRCGPVDPVLFEFQVGRYLVLFGTPPDDALLQRLHQFGTVRWLYRQLGLAEVDVPADSWPPAVGEPVLPGAVVVAPMWETVSSSRAIAVGLNALCAFADRQATDPKSFYRHRPGIGYPFVATRDDGHREVDLDVEIDYPTPPALIPVVNMSLGTTVVGYPTSWSDIVNCATCGASDQVLVVVAAGNCGAVPGDSMSAWARPEFVLSVGAATGPAGMSIAPYSSRGAYGPDLVALGQSDLNPAKLGTSFAAPRVTFFARLVVAAMCELGREVMRTRGEPLVGVPAVGWGIVDDFGPEIWWEPEGFSAFQALPLCGVNSAVVESLCAADSSISITMTPALMRHILLSAARAIPGVPTSDAGAGFIDLDLTVERLSAITGTELRSWFGDSDVVADEQKIAQLRVFERDGLLQLASVLKITGPMIKFDYRSGRWAALPQSDDSLRTEYPAGIPVDMSGIRFDST